MIRHMLAKSRKKIQIFNSVVRSFVIYVMNRFFGGEISAEKFFSNKNMLLYISAAVSLGVIRHVYKLITARSWFIFLSAGNSFTFCRTKSRIVFQSIFLYVKRFATYFTYYIFSSLEDSSAFLRTIFTVLVFQNRRKFFEKFIAIFTFKRDLFSPITFFRTKPSPASSIFVYFKRLVASFANFINHINILYQIAPRNQGLQLT